MPTRIIGIDPGSLHCGWGVLEVGRASALHCLEYGTIELPARAVLHARLRVLWHELTAILARFAPTHAGIESVFHAHNVQSALKLGQARGVALLALAEADCRITELSPAEVKMASVGYGRAEKHQVQRMMQTLLGLTELPPEDAADALSLALAASQRIGNVLPTDTR